MQRMKDYFGAETGVLLSISRLSPSHRLFSKKKCDQLRLFLADGAARAWWTLLVMAQLKRLSAADVDVLRSLQTIPSISQAVEELVLNALDANASSVLVTIDCPNLRLVLA